MDLYGTEEKEISGFGYTDVLVGSILCFFLENRVF